MPSPEDTPTGETAIVVIPPADIGGFADHYRRLYSPGQLERIPAHITLVYPFVPYDELAEAEPRLRTVCARLQPRAVAIRGFSRFPGPGTDVLYLHLADPERIVSLYRAVLAEFPAYPAYGGRFGPDLTPHMTVGSFDDAEELERVYSGLAGQRLYLAWDVAGVYLIYKTEDRVWHPWSEVPLGGGG